MALFSRRPKKPGDSSPEAAAAPASPDATGAAEPTSDAASPAGEPSVEAVAPGAGERADASSRPETAAADAAEPDAAEPDAAASAAAAEAAASVSISVSSYAGLGATPAAPQAEETAAAPDSRPRLGTREWMRASQALLDVARQLMQGHVFLRVKGDARTLLAEGKGLPLAVATAGDRTFAMVYSSGTALQRSLQADGDADTSAMGQPVLTVLRHVFASSYDGIILDPASTPSRAVLPKELLQRAVDAADPEFTVKTLLAGPRTPEVTGQIAEALTRVPLWVAVGSAEGGTPGIAEGTDADGKRFIEVYSHPLEVAVMGRGDNAAPINAAQLARAIRSDDAISGLVVDPAGPWIRLGRDELAPVLALAD